MKRLFFSTFMVAMYTLCATAQVVDDGNVLQSNDSVAYVDDSSVIQVDTIAPVIETPVKEVTPDNNDNLLNDDEEEDEVLPEPQKNISVDVPEKVNDNNLRLGENSLSVADRIRDKNKEAGKGETQAHFNKVWGYRGYLNLSWTNTSLKPKDQINTGYELVNQGIVPDFKSDWAVSLQVGRSYKLHKRPIGNVLHFYIDYTGIDLSGSHFKIEEGEHVYDSSMRWVKEGDGQNANNAESFKYIPWNLEKYELCYGMNVGPSFTLAPFTSLKNQNMHFFKINVYYHIGYAGSFLFFVNNKKADVKNEKNSVISWAHGLTQSFGVCLSYKNIGIGYEHQSLPVKYKSFDSDYGKEKYKFSKMANRFYISFKIGR